MADSKKDKNTNIHKVSFQGMEEVTDGYYQLTLSKEDLDWQPGQYGVFTLPGHEIEGKDFRPFSFASSPEEGHILIGTRSIGEMSNFKKTFFSLDKGDTVQVKGPLGQFVVEEDSSALVFIALGIGITPVRSILKGMEANSVLKAHIVYSSEGYFMFQSEIDEIVKQEDLLSIVYPKSVEETKEEISKAIKDYGNDAYYYISGPPKAIKSVKNQLMDQGIAKEKIKNDPFTGY